MRIKNLLLLLFSFFTILGYSQNLKPKLEKGDKFDYESIKPFNKDLSTPQKEVPQKQKIGYFGDFPKVKRSSRTISIKRDNGRPYFIQAQLADRVLLNRNTNQKAIAFLTYLENQENLLVANQFHPIKSETDELGITHTWFIQKYQNIPIYGKEIIVHQKKNQFNLTGLFSNNKKEIAPAKLSLKNANQIIDEALLKYKKGAHVKSKFLTDPVESSELVLLEVNDELKLAYHFTKYPDILHKWEGFIDANNGTVLKLYKNSCSLVAETHHCNSGEQNPPRHSSQKKKVKLAKLLSGSLTAQAKDLNDVTQTINVYNEGDNYYMVDASRLMYNASASNMPDDGVGVILTIDGNSAYPQNSNFAPSHVSTSNNTWNDRTSVSAHHNAGIAYEYFRNTHNRKSINGSNGTIISLIHISDENGDGFDNAFWNGNAMFYGDGDVAFGPLAKSLDVAGHEISHGVIQNSANLEYVSQSGALNESFADIFGCMMDRDDWNLGEDVVNTQYFPSGALRNLQDPHNGGTSNSQYWQPKHMNEYVQLAETPQSDNGGVHINSGIPNHAFYKFATAIGKSKAEQIYYRALTKYLGRSSQFIDCRASVIQAAKDIHGNNSTEVSEAQNAFAAVGIGSGGSTNTTPDDLETNDGDELLVLTDTEKNSLYLTTNLSDFSTISSSGVISNISVTDNGEFAIWVAADKTIKYIEFDWATGNYQENSLSDQPIWRNCAISKDGSRFAGVVDDIDKYIFVYDFASETSKNFELYNPTFTQGVSTGNVVYADALEFTLDGNSIIYDAYNEFSSLGSNLDYWDIGIIDVWEGNDFAIGKIEKLFSNLPENTSIGNPTFAKNSPSILAFDYIDEQGNYNLLAANFETNTFSAEPIIVNSVVNYPNFGINDDKIVFNAESNGTKVLAKIDMQSNKLDAVSGSGIAFIEDGYRGIFFATGERDLSSSSDLPEYEDGFSLRPNPVISLMNIDFKQEFITNSATTLKIYDLTGKNIFTRQYDTEKDIKALDLGFLTSGNYILTIANKKHLWSSKFLK